MTMRWLGLTAALVGAGALHLPGAHPSDFGVCPSPLSARARSPRRVCARRLSTAAHPCQPPAAAGEAVPLKVNKLWSAKTQLTYDFYSLPCVNQAPTPCLSPFAAARGPARACSAAAGAAAARRRCLGRTRTRAAMRALASGRPRLRRARPRSHSRRGLGPQRLPAFLPLCCRLCTPAAGIVREAENIGQVGGRGGGAACGRWLRAQRRGVRREPLCCPRVALVFPPRAPRAAPPAAPALPRCTGAGGRPADEQRLPAGAGLGHALQRALHEGVQPGRVRPRQRRVPRRAAATARPAQPLCASAAPPRP